MSITADEFMKQLRIELHKPAKKKFPRLKVRVPYKDHTWSMDLVDMSRWSDENESYKWMLNVIDVWTRYAWSVPMKTKNAKEILNAFESIISESKRKPKKIWVDQGTEFYNSLMTKFINDNAIIRYSTYGEHKSCMVERLNRTLKTEMWKQFTELLTYNWISRHDKLLEWYNHKEHSGINKRTPYSMSKYPEDDIILDVCLERKPASFLEPKYNIGDVVRISRLKGVFEKGYIANWSQEYFIIYGISVSSCDEPPVYYLKDQQNEKIKGAFYEPELQLVKYPSVYFVENVIKHDKKNKRKFIKWLGFPEKYNSWIDEKDMME